MEPDFWKVGDPLGEDVTFKFLDDDYAPIDDKPAEDSAPIWEDYIHKAMNQELRFEEEYFNGDIASMSQSEVADNRREALALACWILDQF